METKFLSAPNIYWGLPWWLSGKESACQCRRCRLSPQIRKIPREGNGNPLQYSCLGDPMDREGWWATVHGAARVRHRLATKQQKHCILGFIFKVNLTYVCPAHRFVQWIFYSTFGRSEELREPTFSKHQHIMLQIMLGRNTHSRCKWDQMHLKVRGYKNLVDRVSDSISQITFKKLPFVELWGCVKEEYPQLSEKEINIYSPPFQLHIYVKPGFAQYTSVKTTYGNTEC